VLRRRFNKGIGRSGPCEMEIWYTRVHGGVNETVGSVYLQQVDLPDIKQCRMRRTMDDGERESRVRRTW